MKIVILYYLVLKGSKLISSWRIYMNKKYKILSVILIMMLFITSNISVAIVQASGIESRANICDGVKIKSFYSDGYTSAAITEDGELYCWGNNSIGTVGNGTFINQLTPVKILEGR